MLRKFGPVTQKLKKQVNKAHENSMGVRIYSVRAHAREDCYDIKKTGGQIGIIFDVGANVGQSAQKFREAFPKARICCFEPVRSVFNKLTANTADDPNI